MHNYSSNYNYILSAFRRSKLLKQIKQFWGEMIKLVCLNSNTFVRNMKGFFKILLCLKKKILTLISELFKRRSDKRRSGYLT